MLIKVVDHLKKTNSLRKTYRGIVVDNADPKKIGRIRVTIAGFLEGIVSSLPWMHQHASSFLGGRSDMSFFAVPDVGTEVTIEFPYEDIYSGFYTGFWQSSETHQQFLDEDYPASYGFRDTQATQLKINRAKKFLEFIHTSGMSWKIDADSSTEIQSSQIMRMISEDKKTYLEFNMETGDVQFIPKNSLTIGGQVLNVNAISVVENIGSKTQSIDGAKVSLIYGGNKVVVGGSDSKSVLGNSASTVAGNISNMVAGTTDETWGGKKSDTVVLGNLASLLLAGDRTVDITLGNYKATLTAGNYDVSVVAGNIKLTTATGSVEISNTIGKHSVTSAGDVSSSNSLGKHTVSASGSVESSNASGGITIDPTGKVSITSTLNTEITATVDFVVNATVNATINATAKAQVSAPLIVLGNQVGNVVTSITSPFIDLITGAPQLGVPTIFAG